MGFLTLKGYQEELVAMIGQGAPGFKRGNKRLTRYINMGYFELTGTQEFKELFAIETIPTIIDAKTYPHAVGIQSVRGVIDTTNLFDLRRLNIENFFKLDPATSGKPERWAREGGLIYLWPVPDAVYSMDILHQKEPTALVADIDKTVLNSIWDQAVLLFAAKAAAMIDNDSDKVNMYLGLARNYVGSRITDQAADAHAQGQGTDVAWDEGDLVDLR